MLSYLYKKENLKKTNIKSNKFGNPRQSDESDSRPLTPIAEVEECREFMGVAFSCMLDFANERDCYGSIDMKSEIEVKEEPFPIEEEEAANGSIDVKSEIEVYEEPLDIVEEETSNDEHFDKVCGLDQNQ
ncbi:hypothetical protein Avbf_13761, partial [Armadillidium vulgare]